MVNRFLEDLNILAKISIFLFAFIVLYFFYLGVTTTPAQLQEVDSLTYHIPIAQSIASGKILNPPDLVHGLGFYPSIGETILSVFILLGLPLNTFNLVGLIILFIVSFFLAKGFALDNSSSVVFATTISLLNSVLRLTLTQTIDIWLAIFFVLSLYLLVKLKRHPLYFTKLGVALGLLIGVKYSGVLFAFALLLIFGKTIYKVIKPKFVIYLIVPIFIFGISWYLRNYLITGNPIYPGSVWGFVGHPEFHIQKYNTLTSILNDPAHILLIVQALISEYLFWATAILVVPIVLFVKIKELSIEKEMGLLGLVNFGIFLILPKLPGSIVSDVRYLLPTFIPLILAIFHLAKKYKLLGRISLLALLNAIAVLPQLQFRPKLIFIWLVLSFVAIFRYSVGSKDVKAFGK